MSFSMDFVAKQADVAKIIATEHLPPCVAVFINQAVSAFKPDALVSVKAVGHLYNNDHNMSSATINVQEVAVRVPKSLMAA